MENKQELSFGQTVRYLKPPALKFPGYRSKAGDSVKLGQVLVTADTSNLQDTLTQDQHNLDTANANLLTAQNNLVTDQEKLGQQSDVQAIQTKIDNANTQLLYAQANLQQAMVSQDPNASNEVQYWNDTIKQPQPIDPPSEDWSPSTMNASTAGVEPLVLKRIKIFADLSEQQLGTLIHFVDVVSYEPMQTVIRTGDVGDAMFMILEGTLRARVIVQEIESTLSIMEAGNIFGEISSLDQGPRSADIIANERSTLIRMTAESFDRLRKEAPALSEPILFTISRALVPRLRGTTKLYQDSILTLRLIDGL